MSPAEIAAQLTPADRAATLDQIERLRLAARRMRADADELNAAADRNDRQADALAAMLEGDQPLPAADELAAAAPRHDRGHVVAVAVTLTSAHADRWEITRRPLYGHAHAWRRTLAELATRGRTRAYNASNPRRCTWDSADGDAPP